MQAPKSTAPRILFAGNIRPLSGGPAPTVRPRGKQLLDFPVFRPGFFLTFADGLGTSLTWVCPQETFKPHMVKRVSFMSLCTQPLPGVSGAPDCIVGCQVFHQTPLEHLKRDSTCAVPWGISVPREEGISTGFRAPRPAQPPAVDSCLEVGGIPAGLS